MSVRLGERERCRLCYTYLSGRERSCPHSSSSYHLFHPIERRKFPQERLHFSSNAPTVTTTRPVSLAQLIRRYLRTEISSQGSPSNSICGQCSITLLDIEQCAKYLRKNIGKLKIKLSKSNQLFTSSLAVKYQKKSLRRQVESDIDEEDDDEEEEEEEFDDEEESDDEQGHVKPLKSPANLSMNNLKSNNLPCNDDEDDDEADDDDEDEEEVDGTQSSAKNPPEDPTSQQFDENNPAMMQLRFVQMMTNLAAGSNIPNNNESLMNAFATMQRNMMMKIMTDPINAVQQTMLNNSPITPILSQNKQTARKRKSTPEKRVVTGSAKANNNNGHTSSPDEQESTSFSDFPLELTRKPIHSASIDVQNRHVNSKSDNGGSLSSIHHQPTIDEDAKESLMSADSRRSNSSKRKRSTNTDEQNLFNQQRQTQKKLEPRTCGECGIVLFNDKTHLLHGQTHAKNDKQCWICGVTDDDVKKHILAEHGNQKFLNGSFKCQNCDRAFAVYADLETHMKEHSKKKPFECSICHKRFGQQGNLSCHLRIHSGVKPFNCSSCGKAFRHSNSLRRHARTVHSATRGLSSSSNSLVHPDHNLSLNHSIKDETFDDEPSGLMIPSDDGSSSTGGIPSPSLSNVPNDID